MLHTSCHFGWGNDGVRRGLADPDDRMRVKWMDGLDEAWSVSPFADFALLDTFACVEQARFEQIYKQ